MNFHKFTLTTLVVLKATTMFAQAPIADSAKNNILGLDEIIVSANKVAEQKKMVAQQVVVIAEQDIKKANAQTTADLLAQNPNIFVQKSQLGGGSVVLRGFEANRILMVIDGVRMNNIIYRGGHLQNVITIDNSILEKTEVLFGPSSTVYGSDALGGVVNFITKKPMFATTNKTAKTADAFVRYGSVNNEMTGHGSFGIGGKKFASLTSFTYSSFGDLKGGESENPLYDNEYGERPYYVGQVNGKDSLLRNSYEVEQVASAYKQYDILQKFAYKQNEHVTHGLNLQFSNSTDIPRYDRLTDPSASTGLKYAQWYYGPQKRLMGAYDLNINNDASFFQTIHAGVNYQDIEESRHNRNFGSSSLSHRTENVNVAGLNVDVQRVAKQHNFRFGLDGQYNMLKSTAEKENIKTGAVSKLDTRYPDGDNTMMNTAVYGSHTWAINDKFTLTDGLRLGYIALHSTFVDTSFFHLPFLTVDQKNLVYSGSVGLIHRPTESLKLSLLVSTGFRAPNVDDLAKVFESAPGSLIVPNADLKPEKTLNTELGITKVFSKKTIWENNVYYTRFFDAIVTGKFKYNGQDSFMYNGTMSKVLANQNQRTAYVIGFSSNLKSQLSDNFMLAAGINYTYGRINTDSTASPLDHIPPFMARVQLNYTKNKLNADFFVNYNAAKNLKDYYLNGEDNEQYATSEGMPAWFTLNLRAAYQVHKNILVQAGIDNILDTQYRTFASGINAPGRNIFAAVRFHF